MASASLDTPFWVTATPNDDLFILEETGAIRRIDRATGTIDTWTNAPGAWSLGLAADGALLYADGHSISRVEPATRQHATLTGLGLSGLAVNDARAASYTAIAYFAIDPTGGLVAIDNGGHAIHRLTPLPHAAG